LHQVGTSLLIYMMHGHTYIKFNYELWNNFGGETNHIVRKFSKFKRGWSELLQIQELETHVGNGLKKLEILPLYSQYIFSLPIFVIKSKHLFSTNYQIHSVHTRFKTNLHLPIANLTKFQKGVYYSGIKIFNNLPHNIKDLTNETKLFRNALNRFLLSNSFYNSEEYFNYQR